MNKFRVLNNNVLKLIAAIAMLIDHIGAILFPNVKILRIIGRLAFPIFAFMIAEGCKYTRNKLRYFLQICIFAVVWEVINRFIFDTEMNIFMSFTFSILAIFSLNFFKKSIFEENKSFIKIISFALLFLSTIILTFILSVFLPLDYGFWGFMLPIFVSLFHQDKDADNVLKKLDNHLTSLIMLTIGLILIATLTNYLYQWYALISVVLLFFYSGKRGKINLKYFFYIFYAAHIYILYLLKYLLF